MEIECENKCGNLTEEGSQYCETCNDDELACNACKCTREDHNKMTRDDNCGCRECFIP